MTRNVLFTPVQIGAITLKHRIVMPPLSRLRAQWPSGVPSDLNVECTWPARLERRADLHRSHGNLGDRPWLPGCARNLQ